MDEMSQQEIECAKEKLNKTDKLVYDIKTFVKDAADAIDGFENALQQNYFSEANKEGLLTKHPSFYDALAKIKVQEIYESLEAEVAQKQESLD